MFARSRFLRVVAGLAVIGTATMAGVQIASATNAGTHYTGCLSTTGGLTKFKSGDAPSAPCGSGNSQIQLGDGSGAALPTGCITGYVAASSPFGWYCAPNMGAYVTKTGPLSLTVSTPKSPCPDGDAFTLENEKSTDNHTKKITLPYGTFRPGLWADTHWSIDKITNPFEDSWTGGYVEIDVMRVRTGVTSVVSSFVRTKSQELDNSLPYEREFTPFTAVGTDQYYLKVTARGDSCAVARIVNAEVSFDRID